MNDKEKAMQRFVSNGEGITTIPSPCKDCIHSDYLKCAVYGHKPRKYAIATFNEKCPHREIANK